MAVATAQYHYAPPIHSAISNNADYDLPDQSPQPVVEEFNKSFYTYSAPEQEFEDVNAEEKIAKALKKNLRVIFIKGPENKGLEQAALQLAKSASDDRTAIYVLSKQSDIGSLVNQLQHLKSTTDNKPEVHFVKYRTQAEAETAQSAIQAEYATLPGSTTNNGPRAAAVLDFASKSTTSSVVASTAPPTSTVAPPSRSYIPPRSSYLSANKRF